MPPLCAQADFGYAQARGEIDGAVSAHFAAGAAAALKHYSDAHAVWAFDRTWSLAKFADQGEALEVQDCHDEVAVLRRNLKVATAPGGRSGGRSGAGAPFRQIQRGIESERGSCARVLAACGSACSAARAPASPRPANPLPWSSSAPRQALR